jgi:hypothetical protein
MSTETERRKKNPFTDTSFLIFTGLALIAASLCFVRILSSLVLPPLAGFQAALLEAGLGALT